MNPGVIGSSTGIGTEEPPPQKTPGALHVGTDSSIAIDVPLFVAREFGGQYRPAGQSIWSIESATSASCLRETSASSTIAGGRLSKLGRTQILPAGQTGRSESRPVPVQQTLFCGHVPGAVIP